MEFYLLNAYFPEDILTENAGFTVQIIVNVSCRIE